MPQLEASTYAVVVSASGFKGLTANEVKIGVGRDYTFNPTLEIGEINETVVITAGDSLFFSPPRVESDRAGDSVVV